MVLARLRANQDFRVIAANSGWLLADKLVRLFVGLPVLAWMARYLGPDEFGLWSFALAFTGFFTVFLTLGLDSIVVREIVKTPSSVSEILGTAFVLKAAGALAGIIGCMLLITFLRPGDTVVLFLVALFSLCFLFQAFDVIDFLFQANVQSRFTVVAKTTAFLLSTAWRVGLLWVRAPILWLAAANLLEIGLGALFLLIVFRVRRGDVKAWRPRFSTAKNLLSDSWPNILGGIGILLYYRIDQMMLGQMVGDSAVGIYAAALRISELWYFVPPVIVNSVFPSIVRLREVSEAAYLKRIQHLYNVMALVGIGIGVLLTVFSGTIISLMYGQRYAASAAVLSVHSWAGLFIALGIAHGAWVISENKQKIALYRTVGTGFVNVAMNLVLIPPLGPVGSALAAALTQGFAVGSTFLLGPAFRQQASMMVKSLSFPFQLPLVLVRRVFHFDRHGLKG